MTHLSCPRGEHDVFGVQGSEFRTQVLRVRVENCMDLLVVP